MKTAVSVPDELFAEVERIAQRTGRSRSAVYAEALREYVARHAPDEVTAAINRVMAEIGETAEEDQFVAEAARRTLEAIEW